MIKDISENLSIIDNFNGFIEINSNTSSEVIDVIIDRWVNKIRIAENFKNERNLSIAFEMMATLLISDSNDIENKFTDPLSKERQIYAKEHMLKDVVAFPIIRRIFEKETTDVDMSIDEISEYVNDIFNKIMKSDIEAEFVAIFCVNYTLK
jgi:hypothetical protein